MSNELFPYVRPLTIREMGEKGLPGQYLRKEEILAFLKNQIESSISDFNIDDIVDVNSYADLLFDDLLARKVFREEVQEFAGSYWRISGAQMKSVAADLQKTDSISQAANRIGKRFYPDVFDGYRAQNGIVPDGQEVSIPRSTIAAQDWSLISKKITERDRADIRAKVDDLIDAIRQSDLDEKQQKNALKRAESVLLLIDAPDPPWEVVVDLLNNRYLQAFLSALTIAQMIIGFAS